MDPSPIQQIGDGTPLTFTGIVGALAIGGAYAFNWWTNRNKRDAADGVVVAEDQQRRTVAASVETAVQIQTAMIADLRAQQIDMNARLNLASDQRAEAAGKVAALERSVADLRNQLELAQGLNSSAQAALSAAQASIVRLTRRVSVLEDEIRKAGLPVPPEVI